ncbi:hypothetical protein EYF80_032872 [Liparis tanakae]|uniref:Uncharacterized protein n=1 Tax=Liparis tanakae TaxID=230148 RepID=A0A4Z2GVV1_9TELE|nr:hypothetical protein EYF80_032872 [Liparis tanakae]
METPKSAAVQRVLLEIFKEDSQFVSSPVGAPVPPLADLFTDHEQTPESWELLDRLHVLTARLLERRLPQKGLLRHVIGLGDIHPSHGAHVPPHVPPGTKGLGLTAMREGDRNKESDGERAREKKRHLLLIAMGKFP